MTPDKHQRLIDFFGGDRFAALAGVELLDVAPGRSTARLTVAPHHLNSVGIVQGGAIFTLADFAFAAACNAAGQAAVAVAMNLSCLKPTTAGVLVAEAVEISRSRRISVCTVRVVNQDDALVALFQGTASIRDDRLPV